MHADRSTVQSKKGIDNMANPIVTIEMENGGVITAELYPEKAPITVKNFLDLVEEGFFTGLIFHRVIKGFMIQGGGMTPEFEEKRCKSIRGEFIANGFMGNDIKHKYFPSRI